MIGYYIHHVGLGHLHRALAAVRHLGEPVTALSSRPPDSRWPGTWITLPRDDAATAPRDATAGGLLHWAPLNDAGLRGRMAAIAGWVERYRPSVIVVDLSVEVVMLARLIGVPVVSVTLPGLRDDAPHQLGYGLSDAIVAPWPASFGRLGPSLRPHAAKVTYTGAVSRFDERLGSPPGAPWRGPAAGGPIRVLALAGTGGTGSWPAARVLDDLNVRWTSLGTEKWHPDPWGAIRAADVVVTHPGLGSVADVAIARRPAVLVPQSRPHDEQATTAAGLAEAGLAVLAGPDVEEPEHWRHLIERARARGPARWHQWADGQGGRRMAAVIERTAERFS